MSVETGYCYLHFCINDYVINFSSVCYRVLGMGEAALEAFKELGVKHIQVSYFRVLLLTLP